MLDLTAVKIMGVINVTPNSYSTVGRVQQPEHVLQYAKKLISEGVDIIDIGAEPTNPSLAYPCVSLQEELDRLMPVLERLSQEISVPVSIDTSKPEVMCEAIKHGVKMINDVRAFRQEGTIATVLKSDVMLCLMHMSFPDGKPLHIDSEEFVPDVMTVVKNFLAERIKACEAAGIKRERIIIDPGIGYGSFGKSTLDSLKLLKHLSRLKEFNLPILVGVSRKTFIGALLKKPAEERLAGSLAAAALAAYNGAAIIRTHDVKETIDAVKIAVEILHAN